MDEDEIIVSKNSPLYSYMKLVDPTDDKATRDAKQNLLEESQLFESKAVDPSANALSPDSSSTLWSPLRRIAAAIEFPVWLWIKSRIFSSKGHHQKRFLIRSLLDTRLLDDDDASLLETELETSGISETGDVSNPGGVAETLDLPSPARISLLFFALSVYPLIRCYVDLGTWAYFLDAASVISIITIGIRLLSDRRLEKHASLTLALLAESRGLDDLLRRSLTLTREYEILARGYTVVTRYTVVKSRLDVDPSMPCDELRRAVFRATLELFNAFRAQTLELVQRNSSKEADQEPFLLARADDLNATFEENGDAKDAGMTLHSLHTRCYCMALQRSEFLRIYVSSSFEQASLVDIVIRLTTAVKHWNGQLRRALVRYESIGQSAALKQQPTDSQRRPESLQSPALDYVHSLNLHLRIASEKAIEMEKTLSSYPESVGVMDMDLSTSFEQLSLTLRKCQACLDEFQQAVSRKTGGTNDADGETLLEGRNESRDKSNGEESVARIYDGTAPEIVDQVFEAIANMDDSMTAALDDEADYDVAQFRCGRRNVLEELKSVLTVRSTAMRQRELKALAARRGVSVEDLMEEEERERLKVLDSKPTSTVDPVPDAAPSKEWIFKSGSTGCSFAQELSHAIQVKRSEFHNEEVVLGDDSDSATSVE